MTTHSYNEALEASTTYFNGDELAAKVFVDKYDLRDATGELLELTPSDMHRRLAREFARVEAGKFKEPLSEDAIFALLDRFKYVIPQGSAMAGVGNPYQITSLSNCFVVSSPLDSYGAILRTDQELAQISKRRGGTGCDLGHLRPAGAQVKNAARTSSGLAAWMERYSQTIREVGQAGRRGALMLTLPVEHYEVETFIGIKNDPTKVTGANISVKLSDVFMKAVQADEPFVLRWPLTGKPKMQQTVQARKLWEKIIHSAWLRAEPGLLFWDRILSHNAVDCYADQGFGTVSTNPCILGSTPLLTPQGIRTLDQVDVGSVVWSGQRWTKIVNKWATGIKPVYRYHTRAGIFTGTATHRVIQDGVRVEVQNADTIDICTGSVEPRQEEPFEAQAVMDGLVHPVTVSPEGSAPHYCHIPVRYLQGARQLVRSFLRGFYSANGHVSGDSVILKVSVGSGVYEPVQQMLSSLGIRSCYTVAGVLEITTDRCRFRDLIGFIPHDKQDQLVQSCRRPASGKSKDSYEIVCVEPLGDMPVFDIEVEDQEHTYWTGGLLVSNCSELPLCEHDSCRLMVVNLLSFVKEPFLPSAAFDYEHFTQVVKLAQRLMDDLVDLELEKIQGILDKIAADPEHQDIRADEVRLWKSVQDKCTRGRRTGLGIVGLADMLAAMGLAYGSPESIKAAEKMALALKHASFASSVEMAREVGPFPAWNWEAEKHSDFLLQIKAENPDLYADMEKYGRRNIANLTIAPTGSVAIVAQISSGIEPLFRLDAYTRRKKINPGDRHQRVDFVDPQGDSWQNFEVLHPSVRLWKAATGSKDLQQSPWAGCCAEDICWPSRVRLQAALQRHIDHAISSTINLPESVTPSSVAEIYLTAWEAGCKGITVYRNNCRTGVLVDNPPAATAAALPTLRTASAVKRPVVLPADVFHLNLRGVQYFVVVGLMGDSPYEVFTGLNEHEGVKLIPDAIKHGTLTKVARGCYMLVSEDTESRYNLSRSHDDPTVAALTRMISTALRHGADIGFVVQQLEKTTGDMLSFSKVVARTLKKYIKEGSVVSGESCQSCGSSELRREAGCVTCHSCGWSKCS